MYRERRTNDERWNALEGPLTCVELVCKCFIHGSREISSVSSLHIHRVSTDALCFVHSSYESTIIYYTSRIKSLSTRFAAAYTEDMQKCIMFTHHEYFSCACVKSRHRSEVSSKEKRQKLIN